ncbi:PatB family C-S lyase [uncultured Bacteroides sp.]|uniref:MalY/PatB family protein n=1 Tax=uncultured Bacteroides sp. TaxID=162156 RepID=UPI002AA88B5D|nr:PatB family C-S lyase [uncultured Bacteroides sp.]
MIYNFDEVVDRRNTDALKYDALQPRWGRKDLIPLWVADMDFRTPSFIIEALKKRLENEVLGYTMKPEAWYSAIINWVDKRFNWKISAEMLTFTPGIVPGLAMVIQSLTEEGDKVMVQPPVYHPFFLVTQHNNRKVVYNPLILENGQFRMDMERFKEDIKGCKLFILCNPHNPGGRVWAKEELQEVARICYENQTIVISDEIHADLTLPPHVHHSFATVSEEARLNSIVFMSPSKAFNMPGLSSSYCIIENDSIRRIFSAYVNGSELGEGHLFSFISVAAAYSNGTEWLEQVTAYIQGNIDFTDTYMKEHIPAIKVIRPQASYLIFLDCRDLGLSQEKLVNLFVDGAHLALNDGAIFGKEGIGFMRLNAACPQIVLKQALGQLQSACQKDQDIKR